MDSKKKNVSLRMSQCDLERVRQISERLGVKEADILRFSIKQMITKLAPFQEDSYVGKDLMPALLEVGEELASFFELSSEQLDEIINGGVDDVHKVALDDLKLLALAGVNQEYARMKLTSDHMDRSQGDAFDLKEYLKAKYYKSANEAAEKKPSSADWTRFMTSPAPAIIPKTA